MSLVIRADVMNAGKSLTSYYPTRLKSVYLKKNLCGAKDILTLIEVQLLEMNRFICLKSTTGFTMLKKKHLVVVHVLGIYTVKLNNYIKYMKEKVRDNVETKLQTFLTKHQEELQTIFKETEDNEQR